MTRLRIGMAILAACGCLGCEGRLRVQVDSRAAEPPPFLLRDRATAALITIRRSTREDGTSRFAAGLPDGKPLVMIRAADGAATITYAEGYRPDPTTRRFWEAMRDYCRNDSLLHKGAR